MNTGDESSERDPRLKESDSKAMPSELLDADENLPGDGEPPARSLNED